MKQAIDNVLITLNIQPVLVDVGASGAPPLQWEPMAHHSVYVGFDPDRRELHDVPKGTYARSIVVNEAVTSLPEQNDVQFYLTHSPYCSSTLPPDTESLAHYFFSDLFAVKGDISVRASSLNAIIDRFGLKCVDWLKIDSQGTDLRLFQSLRDDLRNRVLAVDIEPGLIDAYRGEDLFVDANRELLRQGFWLSSLDVKGSVRMKRTTFNNMASSHPGLEDAHIYSSVRQSPAWCEARYLRTLESLRTRDADARDYVLLWVFAVIERQWGYALDIAYDYEQRYGHDAISAKLLEVPMERILAINSSDKMRNIAKRIIPQMFRQHLRELFSK